MVRGINDMFDTLLAELAENTLVTATIVAQVHQVKSRCVAEMVTLCDRVEEDEVAAREEFRNSEVKLLVVLEVLSEAATRKARTIINESRTECSRLLLASGLAGFTLKSTDPN